MQIQSKFNQVLTVLAAVAVTGWLLLSLAPVLTPIVAAENALLGSARTAGALHPDRKGDAVGR